MAGQPVPIDPAWHFPISLDMYHQMIRAGILGEDDHVELLEGVIVAMSPQDRAHALLVSKLTSHLARQLPDQLHLRAQLPLTLARSEPEPDVAVVTVEAERQAEHHPPSALLVIEVANSSLPKDRKTKAKIYAEADVTEYWVIDVAGRAIEVLTQPDPAARSYGSTVRVTGGRLECAAIPGVSVDVDALFV